MSRDIIEMAQKSNAYIDDLVDMSDPVVLSANDCQSEIVQYFAGCNILITGGSGFLGMLLVEKLLR